jgi:hypothetical protein
MALPPRHIPVTQKEQAVARNVSTLLDAIRGLAQTVSGTEATFSQGAVGGVTDGGVKLAIETSIIQACNRLDVILGEKGNWNNKVQEEMFRAVTKTHTLQHSFLEAQRLAAQTVLRPSFQWKPQLVNTGEEFLAVLGDLRNPATSIIGRGPTPAAALDDFDAAFQRKAEDQLTVQPETPTPAKAKKPRKNEKQ